MTKFVARRGSIGLAKEASRGVGLAPTLWVPFATVSFQDRVEEAREEQGQGVIADSDSKYVVMQMGEGDVEAELYDQAIGLILMSLIGAAPGTSGSNPYTHAFTFTNTNQHQSLSIYYKDPDRSDMFPLGVVDSLNMKVEMNGKVQWKIGFKSKRARGWTSQTASFTTLGAKWLHQHLVFKLAANVGSLTAATAISLKGLELTMSANTMFDGVMGTIEPEDILNQQFSVEGSVTLNLEDDTYRGYMLNGTYKAMEIKLDGGANSSLDLRFPRVDFSQWEMDRKLNEIAKQKINFKCNYDQANALDIISTVSLINTKSTY